MITNFVGILIILVMVVGDRARRMPLPDVEPPLQAELKAARAESAAIELDVYRIESQRQLVQAEVAAATFERDQVQTVIAAVEHDLSELRAALDADQRERLEAQRELDRAEKELARLRDEREQAEATQAPETITIESYPTPIGKTVDGKEAHFQLLGGRLTYVPFDALIDRLKYEMRQLGQQLNVASDVVDTLGPIGGFRARYTIHRHDTPRGTYLQVAHLELLPESHRLGEPLDAALAPGSRFREKLSMVSPRQYTITVWTYPDSFDEFRKLKKELYDLGYAVAGRPLPEGMPIGASPHGSRSAAE